jgi:hypothetical protein
MIVMNFHIFYIPSSSGLLIIAFKPKATYRFRKVAVLSLLKREN